MLALTSRSTLLSLSRLERLFYSCRLPSCRTDLKIIAHTLRNYSSGTTIKLDDTAFKLHLLESGPSSSISITNEQAKKLYQDMMIIRRLEATSNQLYKEKIIRGFCHLYTGQEAVAVGMNSVIRKQDNVITTYRCHGWCYLMGISVYGILAELAGRKSGCSRGKGGSMHMYAAKFFGGNGIVGASVPLGNGVAFACKYRGDGGVCFAGYGDGAAHQGQIFESYNMACIYKLPIVFFCENNRYGMGTAVTRAACSPDFYTYGRTIPGIWVNGMNVFAMRSAAEFAIDYVLKNGPIVLEADTYRYYGHSMSDPGTSYRSREEVKDVRSKHDPINSFKDICLSEGLLTEEVIKQVNDDIRKEIDSAVEKLRADPEVELKELYADVYAKNMEPKIRGIDGYKHDHIQINKGNS